MDMSKSTNKFSFHKDISIVEFDASNFEKSRKRGQPHPGSRNGKKPEQNKYRVHVAPAEEVDGPYIEKKSSQQSKNESLYYSSKNRLLGRSRDISGNQLSSHAQKGHLVGSNSTIHQKNVKNSYERRKANSRNQRRIYQNSQQETQKVYQMGPRKPKRDLKNQNSYAESFKRKKNGYLIHNQSEHEVGSGTSIRVGKCGSGHQTPKRDPNKRRNSKHRGSVLEKNPFMKKKKKPKKSKKKVTVNNIRSFYFGKKPLVGNIELNKSLIYEDNKIQNFSSLDPKNQPRSSAGRSTSKNSPYSRASVPGKRGEGSGKGWMLDPGSDQINEILERNIRRNRSLEQKEVRSSVGRSLYVTKNPKNTKF